MTVIRVASRDALYSALETAKGGDSILLAAGDYGSVNLGSKNGSFQYQSAVTIASESPDAPATFSGMTANGVANLIFDGINFDYTYAQGDIRSTRPFAVNNSDNVTIRNSTFDGDVAQGLSAVDDGYGIAIGLSVRGSGNVSVENSEFFNWHRGLLVYESRDITIAQNEVYDIRSDGMDFAAVQGVTIEGNYIHDLVASYGSSDHRDMIQFWTAGTSTPNTDIVIRDNILDIGEGGYAQSIFMRNELVDQGVAGEEMYYRNVLIENNTIYNGHLNGIVVGEAAGVTIRGNSLVQVVDQNNPDASDSNVWVPTIRVKSGARDVTIENNVTADIDGDDKATGWLVRNNAFVQNTDPTAAGYYDDVFVSSSRDNDGGNAYEAVPGGLIDVLGAGSSNIQYRADDALTPRFRVFEGESGAQRIFDAGLSTASGGALPDGAVYTWTFSDGATAQGRVITRDLPGGVFGVQLDVRLPDGRSAQEKGVVGVAGADVVSLGADGQFRAYGYGAETVLEREDATPALDLGGAGTTAGVNNPFLRAIKGADDFDIRLSLNADRAGASGEVFRIQNAFVATIEGDGDLSFLLLTENGQRTVLTSQGVALNDGASHAIDISFSDGQLAISVDDGPAATVAVSGKLMDAISADLIFGNPWGRENFDGKLTQFELKVDEDAYARAGDATAVIEIDSWQEQAPAPEAPAAPVEEPAPAPAEDSQPAPVETPAEPAPAPQPAPQPAPTAGHVSPPAAEDAVASLEPSLTEMQPGSGPSWTGYGYQLDLQNGGLQLKGDAAIVTDAAGATALRLDGDGDYAKIGRLKQYEGSDRLAYSVEFARDTVDAGQERLVWNHLKTGLTIDDRGLVVSVATDEGFKTYLIDDVDLANTETHRATVMIDADADRLQVILDDQIVLDAADRDYDLSGGREWGWSLGTAWNRFYDGDVTDFQVTNQFQFADAGTGNDLLI